MKICLFCKRFRWIPGDSGYSEYTPGYDAEMFCERQVWFLEINFDTEADFRRKMHTAQFCKLYKPIDVTLPKL